MNRLWKIITSRRAGHEMMCWAAESKIGAAFLITMWLAAHVAFAGYAISGKGWFDRKSESFLYWVDLGLFGFALLFCDGIFLCGLLRERRNKRPNNEA